MPEIIRILVRAVLYSYKLIYYWNVVYYRTLNLELMLEYGGESWKVYNEVLVDLLNKVGNI